MRGRRTPNARTEETARAADSGAYSAVGRRRSDLPWPLVALALTLALVAVLPIDLCFFDAQLEGTRALLWVCDAFFLVDLLLQLVNAIVVSVRAVRVQGCDRVRAYE